MNNLVPILHLCLLFVCNMHADEITMSTESKKMTFIGIITENSPLDWKKPSECKLEDGFTYSTTDYSISETFVFAPNLKKN